MLFWKKVASKESNVGVDDTPTPRQKHSSTIDEKNNIIYIFGGHTENNLSNDFHSVNDKINCSLIFQIQNGKKLKEMEIFLQKGNLIN